MSSPIFFMHIPKTAGTSLRYLLEREYRPHLEAYYPPQVPELLPVNSTASAVTGHFKWGFHGSYPARYVTFLREPIQQVISHYRHIQRSQNTDHQAYKKLSIVEFAQSDFAANIQTAYLLGLPTGAQPDHTAGEQAFQQLLRCEAFGITERFDASVVLMRQSLGWRRPYYLTINQGEGPQLQLTSAEIQALQQSQAADLKLYALATALFEERWQALPANTLKLALYRRMNKTYTLLTPWWVRAKQILQ